MAVALAAQLVAALKSRDRAAINDCARGLLNEGVRLGGQWNGVARALLHNGEVSLALRAAERAVAESAGSTAAQYARAQLLAAAGLPGEAASAIEAIPGDALPASQKDHFLGTCAMERGEVDLARRYFRRVIEDLPAAGATWLALAALPPEDDEELLHRLDAAADSLASVEPLNWAQWNYARGAVLDRLDRRKEAFLKFAEAAAVVRQSRAYDPAADRRMADELVGDYTAEAIESLAGRIDISTTPPIFVTGLPRSGTTLVEHILASHSSVAGGGEVSFGAVLAREVGGNRRSALRSYLAQKKGGATDLARLYLHLGQERFGAGRFVDKSLATSRLLGLLATILPEARLVWLRRDPLDCAWSCFRTFFAHGVNWSWALEDIAAHFRIEDQLYAHWRNALGDRLLTVSYEELTDNPCVHIDRILAHVGLRPEPAVYAAHETKRVVSTSSVVQVRQPVNRRAVGAAEPYREWLTPFIDGYTR